MTDDPIDFSALDPTHEATSFERVARQITSNAATELARRRLRQSVWWQLSAWRWPVVASAAIVLAVAIGASQFTTESEEVESTTDEVASALGVNDAMSDWLAADSLPSATQVLFPGEDQ